MNRVYESLVAQELLEAVDIYWDGHRVMIDEEIELEPDLFVTVNGHIDYTYNHEEDNDSTYMTWVEVTIDNVEVQQFRDSEEVKPSIHLNPAFIKKYYEQLLIQRTC